MFERFTDRARRVLVLAQEEARLLNHTFIDTDHLLLGLIHENEGVAARALRSFGITLERARDKVVEIRGPAGTAPAGSPPFTPRAKKALELSLREALQLGHDHIGTEHLLLGLVREGQGAATHILIDLGADLPQVRQRVVEILSGHSPGPGGVDQPAAPGRTPLAASTGPRCPRCQALLEGQVAYQVLAVEPVDPASGAGPIHAAFLFCRSCGVTIAAPTDIDPGRPIFERLTPGGRGRPMIRVFPDKLWRATAPSVVPPAAAVDVLHRGRFRDDGSISGTVAGTSVELRLELPRSASSATGSLGGAPVNVTWQLSDNSTGPPELPATLQGSVGDARVDLRGLFRLTPGYAFDRASVQGNLADASLTASIEPATGAFDTSNTVVATGLHAGQSFELFAAVDGPLEKAVIRGTYGSQVVHLDLSTVRGEDAYVGGSCPAPPPFVVLVIASLLFFV